MDDFTLPGDDQLKKAQTGQIDLPKQPDTQLPGDAQLKAAQGRPEWSDEQYSRESRIADIARTHLLAGKSFDEAKPAIEQNVGVQADQAKPTYRLEEERVKSQVMGSNPVTGLLDPSTPRNVGQVLPFVGAGLKWNDAREYGKAVDRFKDGKASDEDYARIAQFEEQQKRQGQRGVLNTMIQTAASLPGMAGEQMVGAGIAGRALGGLGQAGSLANNAVTRTVLGTAAAPSMYLEQGAQNLNEAKDRDSFMQQAKSYGAALTTGVIQNAILGRITQGNVGLGAAGRALSGNVVGRTAGGILEQSVADVVTGAAGLTTGYGTLGDLAQGKYGDAGKELAVQAMTFGAFAFMHQSPDKAKNSAQDALKLVSDDLSASQKAGLKPEAAIAKAKRYLDTLQPERFAGDWAEANQGAQMEGQQPPTPETAGKQGGNVTTPGQVIPDVLRAAGVKNPEFHNPAFDLGEGKTGEAASLGYPEHFTALTFDPKSNNLRLDFDRLDGQSDISGKIGQSTKVPLEMFRDLQKITDAARRKGLGIEYDAEPRRHEMYSNMLERAGFELKETTGEGVTKKYVWEPSGNVTTQPKQHGSPKPDLDTELNTVGMKRYYDELSRNGGDKDAADTASKQAQIDHLSTLWKSAVKTKVDAATAARAAKERKELFDPMDPDKQLRAEAEYSKAKRLLNEASRQEKELNRRLNKARDEHLMSIKDPTGVTQEAAALKHQDQVNEVPRSGRDLPKAEAELEAHKKEVSDATESLRKSLKSSGWSEASIQSEIGRVIQSASKTAETVAPGASAKAERILGQGERPEASGQAASGQAGRGADAVHGTPSERLNPPIDPALAQKTRGMTPGQLQDEAAQRAADDILLGGPPRSTAMASGTPPASLLQQFGKLAKPLWDTLRANWAGFRANADELAGVIAPRTARLPNGKEAADSIAARAAVSPAVERGTPYYLDKIAKLKIGDDFPGLPGEKIQDENQLTQAYERLGAVFHEERFRHARMAYAAESTKYANQLVGMAKDDPARATVEKLRDYWYDQAVGVKTAIGTYELPSEAKYQEVINSDQYKQFAKDWEQYMTPFQNEKFRTIQGLEEDDPVDRLSQIPGRPFNAIAVREGDTAAGAKGVFTSNRGELRNPKITPYGFAREFTGSAQGYVFDPRRIIENTIYKATEAATKAEMFRAYEKAGIGKWVAPGERPEINGKPAEIFKDVFPPRGTQEAAQGQLHFAVEADAAKEFRKALDTDKPFLHIPGSSFMSRVSLFSLVEAASHIKNLGTFAYKLPIRSLPDLIRVGFGVLKGNPELAGRLRELAELGAVKPKGLETGTLGLPENLKKFDPSYWTGKALDFVDTTMRLVADRAFDRMKASGANIDTSDFARRNYINQLGQYLRRGQNDAVVFLRDTGLGPFATAGTNYTMQGIKSLLFSHGLSANDRITDLKLRAFVAMRMGVALGAATALNYWMWRRPDGDDKTPFGAVKVADTNGKTGYIDVLGLTGWTRGARTTGLLALIEGSRANAPSGNVTTKARSDILHGLAHPAEGPLVNLGSQALTGENTIGMPVSREAKPGEPKDAMNAWGQIGNNQVLRDVWGALLNANPVMAAMSGADRPTEKKKPGEFAGLDESKWRLLGPFGVKFRGSKPGQAYEKKVVVKPVGSQ